MAMRYLKEYGHQLINNGYPIVPITPGTKFPTIDNWETLKITHKRADGWLSNGHARDGIGIRTEFFPFLDGDIRHKKTARMVIRKAREMLGPAPLRWGNRPKFGLMYRTANPFTKIASKAWKDPDGNKCQVEFLGNGQQFVAYAVHPDIKAPYEWQDENFQPRVAAANELTVVNEDDARLFCDWFDEWAAGEGWERWRRKKKTGKAVATRARSEEEYTSEPCGLSIEEVEQWVSRLPNDEYVDYESDDFDADVPNWRNIMFAIWHETGGSQEGRDIAWEWSAQSPKHEKEAGRFFKTWNSANPEDLETPVTFRYVIRLVQIQEKQAKIEAREEHLNALRTCTDYDDLKELCKEIAKTQFDAADTELLAAEVKSAFHRVNGGKTLPIGEARKMVFHEPAEDEKPKWAEPWVYVMHTKQLYHKENGAFVDPAAFDAVYSRFLGGASAYNFAMHKLKIPTYFMPMYKPDDDEEFWFDSKFCVNTFRDNSMLEIPEEYSNKDLKAISIIEEHLKLTVSDKRERELFVSWMAHIVQTRQRPNWAVVLQGVQGDGKSFWGELMGAVLGQANVQKLDVPTIEATHTGWAQGYLLAVIEEIRFHGHNRFDIMNKLKPYITNNSITIHPKNVNAYTALNTQAYMATTNYRDAIPIDENDRRWFILMSDYQSKTDFLERIGNEGAYFDRLNAALNNHTGAIRKWLMEYELHESFNPKGRAPASKGRDEMIQLNKSEAQIAFEEIIENNNHPMISRDLIVSNVLIDEIADRAKGELLNGRQIVNMLASAGYKKLSFRMRLPMVESSNDNKMSIWVRKPDEFGEGGDMSVARKKVVRFLHWRTKELTGPL